MIRQIFLLLTFITSVLFGETFDPGQDDPIQAMRRHSDLQRMENDRAREKLSRRTKWDISRAATYETEKHLVDKESVGTISIMGASAILTGTVTDDDGNRISDVEVSANFEEAGGTWTKTDANGVYEMAVEAGKVWVRLNENDLIPNYLRPREKEVQVEEGATVTVDFIAYVADATISGKVLLDGGQLLSLIHI